jgi:Ala-tRNA(Pro) deacylase
MVGTEEVPMAILAKLREFLDTSRTPYEVMSHPTAYTAQGVAAAQHVPGRELAKVVVIKAEDRFLMAVVPAPRKVSLEKLRRLLRGKPVRLATEEEFATLFPQCEPGAMPPFGNLFGLPVYVDRSLEPDERIVFQAGNHTETVRLRYDDFARLVQPTSADFAA